MKKGDLVKINMPNKENKRNGIKGIVLAYEDYNDSIKVALSTGEVTWMYRRFFVKLNKQEV